MVIIRIHKENDPSSSTAQLLDHFRVIRDIQIVADASENNVSDGQLFFSVLTSI